jgi:putative endonuclease
MTKIFCVYILASKSRRLYVGITSDLTRRFWQHRIKTLEGFTKRYRIDRLVYYEVTSDAMAAIEREKQLKRWSREKKTCLIGRINPAWDDLAGKVGLI